MFSTTPFETHVAEYEQWFKKYKAVFDSEVNAIRSFLPVGSKTGIEIGLGTGRFSSALGIKEGIEPAEQMRKIALSKGIDVKDAIAEKLPYEDSQYDFVLMAGCISYFNDVTLALKEANRVLKEKGIIIIGFIDKNSLIGQLYEEKRNRSEFYKNAIFYTSEIVCKELGNAGFDSFSFVQTLFDAPDEIKEVESTIEGYGKGSFVVVKAVKNNKLLKVGTKVVKNGK